MLHIERIDSLDRAELSPYRTMKWQEDHRRQGIFVAEGEKVVERLIESALTMESMLLPEKALRRLEPKLAMRSERICVYLAEKAVLERLTGFSMYQGVMAVGRVPCPVTLDQVLERSQHPYLFAAVDGLSNAENLGALVRNCVAFGVQGLVVGETSSSPYLRRAVRNSMGAIFNLPSVEVADLCETMRWLKQKGIRCIGAHPHGPRVVAEVGLISDCCVVFGSEGEGLSPPVLEACDQAVAIAISAKVDSLNVGSAAAVFLYEASRQRKRLNPKN